MRKSKLLLTVYAGTALALVLSGCGKKQPDTFTYRAYSGALASNWNPHSWETNADSAVLDYLSEGFVSLQPKDTENGIYQWAYDMAESVTDVTKTSAAQLVQFHGMTEEQANTWITELDEDNPGQIVYQIKLREGLKWQDGTAINADSFVNSGKHLLDPAMKNYRANLFYSGESAIAGAFNYFHQGSRVFLDNGLTTPPLIVSDDSVELSGDVLVQKSNGLGFYIALNAPLVYLEGESIKRYVEALPQLFDIPAWEAVVAKVEQSGDNAWKLQPTQENLDLFKAFLDKSTGWGEDASYWVVYAYVEQVFPEFSWDKVGLQKVDDLTFNYVMANPIDESQALVSFSSTWLVHDSVYVQNKSTEGALTTTKYGTKVENTMSYGPYKLTNLEAAKQMVLERNENWHGYETVDGRLQSTTRFEVNGAKMRQYVTDKVVIDVLTDEAAKQKFFAGELSDYAPTASELSDYTLSDALYQVDETYTMSLFFNANLDALKAMDANEGNQNSVVLSHRSFRKAFSLGIDRAEFVTKTAGYKPAYSLMNNLYYYDVWNDPTSMYRNSVPAMEAITGLYGVEYGEGKPYATLEEAYKSINGYNLTEAKGLMKEAHDALVADGTYVSGAPIKIRVAYSKGPIQSDQQAQITLLQKYLNNAIEGSGFGAITLEAVGSLEDRYGDVPAGKFAIGYGAWGGAAFYPFRNMEVYTNTDLYEINEAANWDPATETLTISFDDNGTPFEQTMSWKQWSGSLTGAGIFANKSNDFKLKVTAFMERAFLDKYYRIPLAGSASAFLLGFQVSYVTKNYNIMYGFGGFRLMSFNYTDKAWADFVKNAGGQVDYR